MLPRSHEPIRRHVGAGFTLVELLLTLVLLLLLFGAVVFNYSSLSHGARLDHGVDQMETLFRFARAEAASRGRRVRIVIAGTGFDVVGGTNSLNLRTSTASQLSTNGTDAITTMSGGTNAALSVVWEPEPFDAPGHFVPLREAQVYVDGILDSIEVMDVRFPGTKQLPTAWGWNGFSAVAEQMVHRDNSAEIPNPGSSGLNPDQPTGKPVQIGFFPDGSSDTVEVIVGALDNDDSRRIRLSVSGLSGKIRRTTLELDADGRPLEDTHRGDGSALDSNGMGDGRGSFPAASTTRTVLP